MSREHYSSGSSQILIDEFRTTETSSSSVEVLIPYPSPTSCAGLASLGGNGATYITPRGVTYTLYCGILPLPIFYDARQGDDNIVNCLADCDAEPLCAAAYVLYETCYYNEQPESYQASDDPEAVLAIRAVAPDPYPDPTT